MIENTIEIKYHANQNKIFNDPTRFKVIAKGRRFGLTKGMANYVIERMLDGLTPVLWVDTTYPNIQRYVERYFIPVLKTIPVQLWQYRQNINELRIIKGQCDFKSADKPENMEGHGYRLIILNEAGIILKNDNLWNETIRPMTLDYKADVIIGGTPKGKRTKGGKKHLFYELFEKGASTTLSTKWKAFQFSSYDNPLLDRDEIDDLVSEISPSLRDQEIFGKFIDVDSESIIKREWWKYYNETELKTKRTTGIYQSWDTAFKKNEENDYSVCTTWEVTSDGYYLKNLYRSRVEFPELKRKVIELYEIDKPNYVLIEDKASGQSLIQELERETRIPIKKILPDKDKVARVHAVTPLIESGRVILPQHPPTVLSLPNGDASASLSMTVINECEEFPNGQYDDIVDSISQFLNWIKAEKKSGTKILTKKRKRKRFY